MSVAAAAAVPSVARADDAAVAEAQQRFQEGLDLADAGKHEPARLKFQQAWAVFKSPAVLYNLARTEQLTGHELEALEHFRTFVRISQTDVKITDAMRDKAKQNAEELARKLGQIEVVAPPNARVTVDGKPVDSLNDPVPVKPGTHRVEATFEGKSKVVTVDCSAGIVVKAKIEFEVSGFTEPPKEGDRKMPTGKWLVPTIMGVAGLAGIGVGIGMAASSQSAKEDSEGLRTPGVCSATGDPAKCAQYDARRDDASSAATISYVGYIAGGVLLAGAAVTYLVWPTSRERTSGVTVKPTVGLGSVGFEGRF
ncbi:MAG: hypothetical protein JST00_02565 [Deltaproteobacteria bacterium]|nr:hypothetical protein [Deltaproteobacteria bacterium]